MNVIHSKCYDGLRHFETDRIRTESNNPAIVPMCYLLFVTPIYAYLLLYILFESFQRHLTPYLVNRIIFLRSIHLFGSHLICIFHLSTLVDFYFHNGLQFKNFCLRLDIHFSFCLFFSFFFFKLSKFLIWNRIDKCFPF